MTVRELIVRLEQMPQDLDVYNSDSYMIEDVYLDKEFYVGDPVDLKCEVIEAVVMY